MPELPEVETVRRSLEPALYDGHVTKVSTSSLRLRQRDIETEALQHALTGGRFVAARRLGKYLLLDVNSGHTLLVHLGMSGQLRLENARAEKRNHTHVSVALSSGMTLNFVDPRRFGLVRVYKTSQVHESLELAKMGPDPLSPAFTASALHAALSATTRDLKSVLLDQTVIAGLGNIYVSEALFEARLSPRKRANSASKKACTSLYVAISNVLGRGLENGGTTLSDYLDSQGRSGTNQYTLRVYGRDDERCTVCAAKIKRIVQSGRSTFYCPSCQGL